MIDDDLSYKRSWKIEVNLNGWSIFRLDLGSSEDLVL